MLRRLSYVLLLVLLLSGIGIAGAWADTLLRINCGGPRFGYQLNGSTVYFNADQYFTGSSGTLSTTHAITTNATNAPFASVYQTCNTSTTTLTYTLPGYRATKLYIARLHFAELSATAVGQRVMNVTINGLSALTNFDIFQAAGGQYIAYDKDVNVVTDSSGRIVIQFAAVTGSSCINAIEVLSIPRFQTDFPLPAWAQGAQASDGGGVTGAGPSAADSVNAGSGVYENNPGADIGANNPVGPSPVFARSYRTKQAFNGSNSPGLPVGWTHNYDLLLVDAGATLPITPLSTADPQTLVLPPLPTAQQMRLRYPNGALEQWTYFPPTGTTAVPLQTPNGTPYSVTGLPRPQQVAGTPTWIWLKVTFKDRSQWLFTPYSTLPGYYRLSRITNVMGHFITLNYDTANRLTSITNDAATPATLLAFNYGTQGYLQSAVEYTDSSQPRSVLYTCANGVSSGAQGDVVANDICLLEVSQIALLNAARPARWKYAYQDLLDGPFMLSVSAPNPAVANNYVTHTIAYDSNDFVKMLTDADNNTRAYTYLTNGSGANIQVKGADTTLSQAWTQAAGGFNLDVGSTDANNKQDSVTYGDPANPYSPTNAINKNGQSAQMTYDRSGNVTSTAAIVKGNLLTTTYTYDYTQFGLGQLTTIKTGSKTATHLYYNAAGLVSQIDTPKPNTHATNETVSTYYTYTPLGNVLTVTMPAPNDSDQSVTITYNYTTDASVALLDPPGGVSQNEALGRPLTVTDPMGHVTHYRYDKRGNVIAIVTVVNGSSRETDLTYNVADQLVQVKYPATGQTGLGQSSMSTSYQYPGGPAIVTALYNEAGGMARQTNTTLGGEGQMKAQTGSAENASFVLDGLSRLAQLKDGNGSTFQHVYDNVGNLQKFTFPGNNGANSRTATYDAEGNPKTFTDALSRTATYALAPDDSRLTGVSYNDPLTPAATYDYDEFGRVISITDSTVTLNYSYDDLDNVTIAATTYTNVPTPFVLTYTYFPDGHRKSLACATLGPTPYSYTYDLDGKLTAVTFPWGNTTTYTYDAVERLIAKSGTLSVTQYAYNALDQLTTQESRVPGGDVQAGYYNLTYDAVGNLTSLDDNYPLDTAEDLSSHRTFVYDNQDRLTQEGIFTNGQTTTTNHAYDPADNFTRLRGNAVISNTGAQQLTDDGTGTGYTYDAEGNTWQSQSGGFPEGYTYDALNRLLKLTSSANTTDLTLSYRPDGLLGSHKFPPVPNAIYSMGTVYNIYDGTQKLFDYSYSAQGDPDNSGPTLQCVTRIHGWGATGIEETFFHGDFLHSAQGGPPFARVLDKAIADIADPLGNIATHAYGNPLYLNWRFFDAFGLMTYDTQYFYGFYDWLDFKGQSGAITYYYGGLDSFGDFYNVPGLILMGYRWYNPSTGRFWTRDPQGYDGGINLYAFCRNNPLNHSDPMGLEEVSTGVAAVTEAEQAARNLKAARAVIGAEQAGKVAAGTAARRFGVSTAVRFLAVDAALPIGILTFLPDAYHFGEHLANNMFDYSIATCSDPSFWKRYERARSCFVAGTLVAMADGTYKPIEQIVVGDKVMSRDPLTGRTEAKSVVQTFVREVEQTLVLSFANGEQIETTPGHPFFVEGKGFVLAGQLALGNALVTRAGPATILVSIQNKTERTHVYNFEVADFHTYFVGNRNGGLWVHNLCWNAFQHATKGMFSGSTEAAQVYGEIQRVLSRVSSGVAHPYARDGIVFQNRIVRGRSAPELPVHPLGYYHEYTIPTPGLTTRGARRLVMGNGGEIYYTNDHYTTFAHIF